MAILIMQRCASILSVWTGGRRRYQVQLGLTPGMHHELSSFPACFTLICYVPPTFRRMTLRLHVTHGSTNFRPVAPPSWERHPDGSGLRPVDHASRGNVNLPCPECAAPLVRDASEDFVFQSWFVCPKCERMVSPHDEPEPGTNATD